MASRSKRRVIRRTRVNRLAIEIIIVVILAAAYLVTSQYALPPLSTTSCATKEDCQLTKWLSCVNKDYLNYDPGYSIGVNVPSISISGGFAATTVPNACACIENACRAVIE